MSPSSLRHAVLLGQWQQLAHGVYLTDPGPPTRSDWARVGIELAGPAAALSGWDALRVTGLGQRRPPGGPVLVLDCAGRTRTIGRVHIRPTTRVYDARLIPYEHPDLGGVPVVAAARAVSDTSLALGARDPVRALVTSSVQRGVCTPADLAAELDSMPRRNSGWFRSALVDVTAGARSIAEAEAIELLTRRGLGPFEVNVEITDAGGTLVAVVDIYWRRLGTVLEIDSREFHFSEQDWQATLDRHNLLTRMGLSVVHYPPSRVREDPHGWLAEVSAWLANRQQAASIPGLWRPRH